MNQSKNDSDILQDDLNTALVGDTGSSQNALILCDPVHIQELFSQMVDNPYQSIEQLWNISEQQHISITGESLSLIMTLLSDSFTKPEDSNLTLLREYIYRLLINSIGTNMSYIELLSNPTNISLLLKEFPQNYYCSQLLTKIVDLNPPIVQYIFEHEINEQKLAMMLAQFQEERIIHSELLFFSTAFSKCPNYIESLMNNFTQFLFSVITSCLQSGNDNLLENSKEALKILIGSFNEFAVATIQYLPALCVYDEIDDDVNMSTLAILEAIAKKLDSYAPLFESSPNAVATFIQQNFDVSRSNDYSVFTVLQFLLAIDDLSPLLNIECEFNFSNALITNLILRIQRNEKYEIMRNSVIVLCHLLKCETSQTILEFVQKIDFGLIFQFADISDSDLSIAILETIIKIDEAFNAQNPSDNGMSAFLQSLSENENVITFISDQLESQNEDIARSSNYLFEKMSQ